MRRIGAVVAALLVASIGLGEEAVRYDVRFGNAAHHEVEIQATFPDLPPSPLEALMSRSSPGRYALHEFAKNVYDVRAFDGKGKSLRITRSSPNEWSVAGHDGTVRMSYTLFGDRADGTYVAIDRTHAHLNMPATFMWARGLEERPIVVRFHVPEQRAWKIATQLPLASQPFSYSAPDLSYFFDSPTEIADLVEREWKVSSHGENATVRLAVHHEGTDAEVEAYAELAKAVVLEEEAVFGELPRFDYGAYTFIADYLPDVPADGMEHRNSTVLTSTEPLSVGATSNLATLAHEFFHSWNVERMRPRSLEPFNFEAANPSGELWFAEGFTTYYQNVVLKRIGAVNLDRFASSLGAAINQVVSSPARAGSSAVEMSLRAPLVDAAASVDATHRANTYISYYTYGNVIALGLDLTLRTRFHGLSLDDFMRAVWRAHPSIEKPYTNRDLRAELAKLTDDERFAAEFFAKYVEGPEVVDYRALLAHAGLLLREKTAKLTLGEASFTFEGRGARLSSYPLRGTPLYEAGLDKGDVLLSLSGEIVESPGTIEEILSRHAAGESLSVRFEGKGVMETVLKPVADPSLELVPYEQAGLRVTHEIEAFRESWLGARAHHEGKLVKVCPRCRRTCPFELEFCPHDGERLALSPSRG